MKSRKCHDTRQQVTAAIALAIVISERSRRLASWDSLFHRDESIRTERKGLPKMSAAANAVPPLAGQIAVITGASGGIGRTIALELARAGAALVVHGFRRRQSVDQLAAGLAERGSEATIRIADLASTAARDAFAAAAWDWKSGVDILVNCAGADVLTGAAADWPFEQKLEALWQVDVVATIDLSRAIGARMQARGSGTIINIGWDQAEQGMAGDSGEMFAAVKGAVMAFTRSLAQSLAPQVRVNCVAPGWIRTAWGEHASEYWQDRAARQSLRGRWGTADDVARAALFLASPAADFISGQVVAVNGGFRYE
jgi:3-oxoacyl-[acyl-carrier protein] reductase